MEILAHNVTVFVTAFIDAVKVLKGNPKLIDMVSWQCHVAQRDALYRKQEAMCDTEKTYKP